MCDYSVQAAKTRDARIGDKLVTSSFGRGHVGFMEEGGNPHTATCLKPGTELAFEGPVYNTQMPGVLLPNTAKFTQVNHNNPNILHDVLEFPNGNRVWLAYTFTGVKATVLQLPAEPKTADEAKAQERAPYSSEQSPVAEVRFT